MFLILLLIALNLGAFGFNYPDFQKQNVNYYRIGSRSCSKTPQPLCGTNGNEFIYFKNKCEFELKNYELLTQGLMEYNECPLSFCKSDYSAYGSVNEADFVGGVFSGISKHFPNPYDVELIPYNSQKDFLVDDFHEYNYVEENRFARTLNTQEEEEEEEDSECPKFCSLKYQPICGILRNLRKEFLNECELKRNICLTKQKWNILNEGPCEASADSAAVESLLVESNCPQICPFEYKPICAKFENEFREFANGCELESTKCQLKQDWQITNEWPCFDRQSYLNAEVELLPPRLKCSQICTSEYKPVCAKFNNKLRLFSNKCKLERTKCETNDKWEIVKSEECTSIAHVTSVAKACLKSCSKKYSPVCAVFKNEIREFSNRCLLENWNCESDKKWEITNLGPCSLDSKDLTSSDLICPTFCIQIFNPVCAKLGNELREFPNGCELERAKCESKKSWEVIKFGPCLPQPAKCPQFCSSKYKPICAVLNLNLKEFQNECQMQKTICETNENWKVLKKGRCPLISGSNDSCPSFCIKAFSPVCARHKDELQEFFNICEFQKSKCETNIDWKIFNRGFCLIKTLRNVAKNSCDNEALDPICGVFSLKTKTFDNICQLVQEIEKKGEDWSILYKGYCTNSATKPFGDIRGNTSPILKVPFIVTTEKSTTKAVTKAKHIAKNIEEVVATISTISLTAKNFTAAKTMMEFSKKKCANDEIKVTTERSSKYSVRNLSTIKTKEYISETISKEGENSFMKKIEEDTSYNSSSRYNHRSGTSRQQNLDDQPQHNWENTLSLDTVHIRNDRKDFTHSNNTYMHEVKASNDQMMMIARPAAVADNTETNVKVLDKLLPKSDDKEENIKILLSQRPTILESEASINYPKYTETKTERATHLNSFKLVQNSTKFNSSNAKKGEIYNGVVYKGAVYDAPTYNFIYTAPNHYVIPVNFSSSAAKANNSFDFLKLILAMNGGLVDPNLSPALKGNLVDPNINAMQRGNNLPKLPLNIFSPSANKKLLQQNHLSAPMLLPHSQQLIPFLSSLNSNSALQLQNSRLLQRNKEIENKKKPREYQNNFVTPQAKLNSLNPLLLNNLLLQERSDKILAETSGKIPRVASQPLSHSTALPFSHHLRPAPFRTANSPKIH